jgi:Protein kinase domain
MLGIEDLLVASLVARQSLMTPEALRALLYVLDGDAERRSLARTLHERNVLSLENAKGFHDAAQRKLRLMIEERFLTLLRSESALPPAHLQALALEQAQAGYAWRLSERLVTEGLLGAEPCQALSERVRQELQQESEQYVARNRAEDYTPALTGTSPGQPAPAPAAASPDRHLTPGRGADAFRLSTSGVDARRNLAFLESSSPDAWVQAGPAPTMTDPVDGGTTIRMGSSRPLPLPGNQSSLPEPGDATTRWSSTLPLPGAEPDAAGGELTVRLGPGESGRIAATPELLDPTIRLAPGEAGGTAGPVGPEAQLGLGPNVQSFQPAQPSPGLLRPQPQAGSPAAPDGEMTIRLGPGDAAAAQQPALDPLAETVPHPSPGRPGLPGGPQPPGRAPDTVNMPAAAGPLGPGASIAGRYEIVRELGRGNMGVVYLANDPERGEVAVKLVQGPANQEARGRFKREILVSRRLSHPNLIHVFDAGQLDDGANFMVMEVLGGCSMKDLISEQGAQSIERAVGLTRQLLEALAVMHAERIVHRDIKPDNVQVMSVDGRDHIKVMDFGIARFLGDDVDDDGEEVFVTMRGTLSGTPMYVAPEAVLEPELITPGHDVYAVGVTLYELLTGSTPFPESRTLRDILTDTLNSRARPLDEARPEQAPHPPQLERLIRRLLEKDPEARPQDAVLALEALLEAQAEFGGGGQSASGATGGGLGGFFRRLFGGK